MKKILSVLLAAFLLAGCLPLGAWADEGTAPPLGVVGFRKSAEDAKTALTTASGRWNLSAEQAEGIFSEANNSITNWMWAALPQCDDLNAVKTYLFRRHIKGSFCMRPLF